MQTGYSEVWCIDFEFYGGPGNRPVPLCMVAREYYSRRTIRLWQDEFGPVPPFPADESVLVVAFYASAEFGCFRALGWPLPARVLDLFTEFRARTNISAPADTPDAKQRSSLIAALNYFGQGHIAPTEKKEMRELILTGGPFDRDQVLSILDYCDGDVTALEALLPLMSRGIDLPHALWRGRYMANVGAGPEYFGTPVNTIDLGRVDACWDRLKSSLIDRIDANYGVYDDGSFNERKFEEWLDRAGIVWPRLDSGRLNLREQTFREMAAIWPVLQPLRELRASLSDLRLHDITVGDDGRNRCLLSAFRSRTGRNQPSNSKCIWGPAVWIRGFIQPPPGCGLRPSATSVSTRVRPVSSDFARASCGT